MKFLLAVVFIFTAVTSHADVIFGTGGRAFTPDDWTVTGTTLMRSDSIGIPSVWTDYGSLGTATVSPSSTTNGIVVDVYYAGWTSSRSLAIIDSSGRTRLEMAMTNNSSNRSVRATAMGVVVGEVPYRIGNTLRATFLAPTEAGSGIQWIARIEDLGVGIAAEHREVGTAPLLFSGPITVRLQCGYAVSGNILRVALLGEQVVPAEASTWGTIKALFR